ncbi:hypothetical protein KUTeg_016595 [Tegillarca granosa]|uniref:Laminin G domain-containing protein n=1 Tax=Tegillarca granosa TaxID=220873 RepID=A0ABQ9ELI9_TEGGR|nr:hypothetical protein KUTeg_016595 [Tegillarca granosa]
MCCSEYICTKPKCSNISFDITFGFRTYHNGIFFYLTNSDQTEYLVTQLMNGQVVLFFYDQENGFKSINSTAIVTDGLWHTVSVRKGTKRIRLIVDEGVELRENIKRKLNVISPMYVGGYPDGLRPHPEVMDHSMRGCLRDFQLNSNPISITESEVVSGTSPCFQKVEPGVFLTGFSYGIYSQNFKVGDGLTINLEFRTNKQNGIFLTISDPGGFPAMTLELHNGKVKMSVRSSEDKFTAETVNDPYLLCDNKWHKIQASVIKNVVSVVVDDLENAYGSSGGSQRFSETNSQLFLGGFPSAIPQGAAFTDAGFSGCLRNFVIDNNQVDWYQLVSSVDLHKAACPVENL